MAPESNALTTCIINSETLLVIPKSTLDWYWPMNYGILENNLKLTTYGSQ